MKALNIPSIQNPKTSGGAKKAFIIVGLGFGDEGKGTMVDFLCRTNRAKLVVRYNGGSQAAHNVVTDDGRHHTFAQIGSGAFVPGVKTLLSKFMLLDPISLVLEAAELSPKIREHALSRHFIDPRTSIITPYHVASNRIKEWIRDKGRHGSCGKGIGETGMDLMYHPDEVIRASNLLEIEDGLAERLDLIRKRKYADIRTLMDGVGDRTMPGDMCKLFEMLANDNESRQIAAALKKIAKELNILPDPEAVNRLIRGSDRVVFEGAQGMLLDEWHGFHPYTTWSTITPKNAIAILEEAGWNGEREVIGMTRIYATRHGAGPFVTENATLRDIYPSEHNGRNSWQGEFRVGDFDSVALRYAISCAKEDGGIDVIALTHLDVFDRDETILAAEAYLLPNGSKLEGLVPVFDFDLDYQAKMTDVLMTAKPVYSASLSNAREAVSYVEQVTGLKVKYTSAGTAAKDKAVLAGSPV